MSNITVQRGENVFEAVARGFNTRMDYELDDPFNAPIYRVDIRNSDGPHADEYPEPVATVSSTLWTYNVYRYNPHYLEDTND